MVFSDKKTHWWNRMGINMVFPMVPSIRTNKTKRVIIEIWYSWLRQVKNYSLWKLPIRRAFSNRILFGLILFDVCFCKKIPSDRYSRIRGCFSIAYLVCLSNQSVISCSLLILCCGLPLLLSSWFSPWKMHIRVSMFLYASACIICMPSGSGHL